MSRRKSLICLATVVLVSLVASAVFKKGINATKRAATIGTVRAISSSLHTEARGNQGFITPEESGGLEWQTFSRHEYDKIIEIIGQRYNLDAPVSWDISEPLIDVWGKRFLIVYRQFSGDYDFIVVSAGSDRIFSTPDDIASDADLWESIQRESNGSVIFY